MNTSTRLLTLFFFVSGQSLFASPFFPLPNFCSDSSFFKHLSQNEIPEKDILTETTSTIPEKQQKEETVAPTILAVGDLCGQGTGWIDLTPDPNTQGPWQFHWSNGATTEDLSGLTAGAYTVTILDANGVVQQAQAIVQAFGGITPQSVTNVINGNTLCDGVNGNGSIDITVTPNPNSWSYLWSNGATTMDISNLSPGLYTVSITFGVTCTTTFTYNVPDLTNHPYCPVPGQLWTYDICESGNGSVNIPVTGGTAPYTFSWSNGATTQTVTDLPAGTYTVTVTDVMGCTLTNSQTIQTIYWPISVDDGVTTPNTICIGANGTVTIDVQPKGVWYPTYTYQWSNGATTENLVNVPSGSYRVTVTRLGVCTATEVFYVEDMPNVPNMSISSTTANCGFSNGALNLTVLPGSGAPAYTYLWSNGATTQNLTNLAQGEYTVTVTGTNGCTATISGTVDDTPIQFGYSAQVFDNTSCDTIDGKISLSLFPANLTYTWSNGATTKSLINLAPGDYTVTVSAGGTCTAVETYSVGDLREYPVIPLTPTPSHCSLANGAIDLAVNGQATSPFKYLWSNGATTQDLSGIKADTFYVTVTSAVGCSSQNQVIVTNINDTLHLAAHLADNISCAAPTGFIALHVTPVDTNYVYLWSNSATTDSLSSLAGGTYLVTVTLGISCIALDTFTVNSTALPPGLSTAASAATCGLPNGSADLSLNGGAGPFSYAWSNATTTEDLSNLPPGTYTVTVTGSNACTASAQATVADNTLALNVNGTAAANSSCATANGSIDIGITPSGTYTYAWSNTFTTEDLSGLSPGTYTVTVSLGNCQSSNTFSVADNALSPGLSSAGAASLCGMNDGAIDLTVSGGVGAFTYVWSNTATTEDLSGLAAGTYTVTVTGSNACTASTQATVSANTLALNVAASPTANTSCTNANGSIDVSVTPAGAYTYAWSNAALTEDLSGLNSGLYTVTVSFGTCQSSSTFSVNDGTQTPNLSTNITASICGAANGAIDLTASGPAGSFNYAWSNAALTEDLSGLLPGTYTVTVTATNGCSSTAAFNVANNASTFSLSAAAADLTDCAANNGAIDLTISAAGAYTYAWSNGATTQDLSSLPAGTYTVSVTESGSCTATATYFVIDQRSNPLTAQSVTAELCGLADGAVDLTVSGGVTPYIYAWTSGQTTQDLSALNAGTYTVTVTDVNHCTATAVAVVPGNSIVFSLSGTPTANASCLQPNGAVDLTVSPAGAYTYQWSNLAMTQDLSALNAGTYTVTVSAGGNCVNTVSFTVTSNVPQPQLSPNITAGFCGAPVGAIDLTVGGSSPAPYTYQWSNQATTEDLTAINSGAYTVTVTAANGCSNTDQYTVPENVFVPTLASQLTAATSCVANNGAIDLTVTPAANGPYTYNWSNGAQTEDLQNIAAGVYTVTVSAGGACTNTSSLTVSSNIPPPVLTELIAAATCGQASGSIDVSVTGNNGPFDYLWSNNAVTEDLNNLISGTYTLVVTDQMGCTATGNYIIPENVILPVFNGTATPVNSCLAPNGSIALDVQAPVIGVYTYNWSNGASTEDLSNIAAGAYTVTINGGGSCTATASYIVDNQTVQPLVSITAPLTVIDCITPTLGLNGTISGSANAAGAWFNASGTPLGAGTTLQVNAAGQYFFAAIDPGSFCADTASISITQSINPPTLSIGSPAVLTCAAPAQTLAGGSTTAGVQLSWATISGTDTTIVGNGANLPVNTAGTYYLLGFNPANHCANAVSVNVTANQTPPVADAGPSFTLDCAGETAPLDGSGSSGSASLAYQWSSADGHFVSGANTAAPLIDKAGTYTLVVTNNSNGCTDTAEVTIAPEVPLAFASVQQPTCQGAKGIAQIDSVTGLSEPILYSLDGSQPGSQGQFGNLEPGIYTLTVSGGNGCSATTSVTVETPEQVDITLDPAATVALGHSIQIDAGTNLTPGNIASILWTPATGLDCDTCLNPTATPTGNTEYALVVVSKVGCSATARLLITVDKRKHVYAPNIFSPDGDGKNDVFTLLADPLQVVNIKSLRVFNRWGEEVYERKDFSPADEQTGWDGTFKGKDLNPAVFVWQAVVQFADGQEEVYKGDVTLIR